MVTLRLTTSGLIEVDGYIISNAYNKRGTITFVLDTGSRDTVLGVRDAEALGFNTKEFPHYTGLPIGGIGGKGRPLEVGTCEIILGDAEIVDDEDVLFFMPEKVTAHRTRGGLVREKRERIFAVPSLLGTGFLQRNKCIIEIDYHHTKGQIVKPK